MSKSFLSIFILAVLILATSCRKTLKPPDDDRISFIVRLPSISQARFEARCVTEDILLDQVIIQSPSAGIFTEEFYHQGIAKDEIFLFGNQEAEDGLWLITFIGVSSITNYDFHQIVPYEMLISGDDDNN